MCIPLSVMQFDWVSGLVGPHTGEKPRSLLTILIFTQIHIFVPHFIVST